MPRFIEKIGHEIKDRGILAAIAFVLGTFLSILITITACYGVWTIVLGAGQIQSSSESIGIALLAVALAWGILLIAKSNSADQKASIADGIVKRATILGYSFIVAALMFALFGFLSPILAIISNGQPFFPDTGYGHFFEVIVQWTAFISLMAGTITLIVPLSFGPFLILTEFLSYLNKRNKIKTG